MYQTNDYLCSQCKNVDTMLVDTKDRDLVYKCTQCGGDSHRTMYANITRASYLDGNNRWKSVREMREIDKTIKKLKRDRATGKITPDTHEAETARLKSERKEIQAKGRTKKAELPPKVEN